MATLTFLGAAKTVTGSKYLVDSGGHRVLVDCGLFQGLKELRELNWQPLPIEAASIDAVVLTHAHIDHTGYLPRLIKDGFKGRVFCTPGTADLCRVMLPDAGRIAEEDAKDANRAGYTKHTPALPLFTEDDALRALTHLQPVGYQRPVPAGGGIEIEFHDAGHLLGSSFVRMSLNGAARRVVVFGGDLGRYDRPVLPDPQPLIEADVLLVESTYGDRRHGQDDGGDRIAAIINDTLDKGGKIIVPSFAVGRVEEVLYWLKKLEDAGRIPTVPVYLDSPMAIEALRLYRSHSHDLDPDVRHLRGQPPALATKRFTPIASVVDSKQIQSSPSPCIVVSASGMASGGRVLYHLKTALPNPRNTILFVGYQAAGTRGRAMLEGAQEVKIHGHMVPVEARVESIDSMSAHADADEILRWLRTAPAAPSMTYLVHGEPPAQDALQTRIRQELGWTTHVADYQEQVAL